ncbi:hypothetical protein ACFL2V_20850 [Pseudomonadota bacterium]
MYSSTPEKGGETQKSGGEAVDPSKQDKAKVTAESELKPEDNISDAPLPAEELWGSERKRPKIEIKGNDVDISDMDLGGLQEEILVQAKKNMKSKGEYGDINEITVENTAFIKSTDSNGLAIVQVYVRGLSSEALIGQTIPLEIMSDGRLALHRPPITEQNEEKVRELIGDNKAA